MNQRSKQKIVITGIGVASSFGLGYVAFAAGLKSGLSGINPIENFNAKTFPVTQAGEVKLPLTNLDWLYQQSKALLNDEQELQSFLLKWANLGVFRDRKVSLAWFSALEAIKNAKLPRSNQQAALHLGLGLEQAFLEDFEPFFENSTIQWAKLEHSINKNSSLQFRSEVDLSARMLAEWLEIQKTVSVNTSACAAGTMAIAQAANWIQSGLESMVITGAADSMINPLGTGGMAKLGAPSPDHKCRPFDLKRNGLVMGEGAAIFVIENEQHAIERGVKPLATISGWGITQDGYRVTAPKPDGSKAIEAMQRALDKAQLKPKHVDYINAHGTGTPLNDISESNAIHEVFHRDNHFPLVSSIKGAVGHCMAAAGALELAACLIPLNQGWIPGTLHHQTKDPQCSIAVIPPGIQTKSIDTIMSNSFGFGGQNASIIIQRY